MGDAGRLFEQAHTDPLGSRAAAKGAQKAAAQADRRAQEQLAFAKSSQERAIAAAESPEELAALRESLNLQRQNLRKQQTLFDALDPAILAASQQAADILAGGEAKFLQPLRERQSRDEQKLLAQLREQGLDPTSSAGQQALENLRFHQGQQIAGVQQQSLGQLFGIGQSGTQGRSVLGGQISQLANIGQGFGNLASRRVGAITGSTPFVTQAHQQLVGTGTAGLREAGFGATLGAGFQAGSAILGGLFGGPAGAAAGAKGGKAATEGHT